ncbi:MAG: helix-turn-helix transcriptional regulator [Symbiobacteriia bacterium]
MATLRETGRGKDRLGQALQALANPLYIGRQAEHALFLDYLLDSSRSERILNVHGPGGVGKSTLLDQFRYATASAGGLCLSLDCRDIPHPPDPVAEDIVAAFDRAEPGQRLVLLLDTYEEIGDRDRWLRDLLLTRLPARTLVVIAGRRPLRGSWLASPAWRCLIQSVPLGGFDRPLTREYLQRRGITDESLTEQVWAFTHGHPLGLSLATSLVQEGVSLSTDTPERAEMILDLTRCWLREVPDEALRLLVEAAAAVRSFDEESLAYLIKGPVSHSDFDRLTALSFVRLGKTGWGLHDLVRAIVSRELQWRAPERSHAFWQRSLAWYRGKLAAPAGEGARSLALHEFFLLLKDPLIRALYSDRGLDDGLYVEPARPSEVPELKARFALFAEEQRRNPRGIKWVFHDPETHAQYSAVMTAEVFKADTELLDLDTLLDLEPSAARLCKDAAGQVRGVCVIIPVNRNTIGYLRDAPVSGPYFRRLTPAETAPFLAAKGPPKAWFYRYIAVFDPSATAVARALFRDQLLFLLREGRMIASSSVTLQVQVLRDLGFAEVPGATNQDLGPGITSLVFVLDPRGPRLLQYLDRLAARAGQREPALPANGFGLTAREREVVQMVVAGLTNAEIATKLVISEVTVKKHLTHVFAKTGATNRTQLVRKLIGSAGD